MFRRTKGYLLDAPERHELPAVFRRQGHLPARGLAGERERPYRTDRMNAMSG